jgi:hypothetical protein
MLALPVLDKEDILEGLFESLGIGDAEWRTTLSRSADAVFCRVAPALGAAILVSWWHHPNASGESGTPTAWLSGLSSDILEIHCECRPRTAAARFTTRQRHPGHLDAMRTREEIIREFEHLALLGPLGCGRVIRVNTEAEVALDELVSLVTTNRNSR